MMTPLTLPIETYVALLAVAKAVDKAHESRADLYGRSCEICSALRALDEVLPTWRGPRFVVGRLAIAAVAAAGA